MVKLFIEHVLGVKSNHTGLYGDTEAYYGTVEQQGRLTLHMHMLLWLRGSLSPQEIRDRIMNPNSDFQKAFVEYLESVHVGEFMTGTMDGVKAQVAENSKNEDYKDPTQTLPEMPPPICKGDHEMTSDYVCRDCRNLKSWWEQFRETTDDLILRSDVHNCGRLRVLIYKESFYHVWRQGKNGLSSFRLIISFTTKVVTVGIKVLKQSFTSEFKISRDADFEHFRKVFPTVQPCLVKSPIPLHSSRQHQLYTVRLLHYTDMSITPFLTCWSSLSSSSS
jgi:hypothetical protein